jgi:AhpD family alkylhydroperoxidase
VPNTFAAIGAYGPAALKAVLSADAVLAAGTLSKRDQETIKLVISAVAGCDYCVAAHNLLGKLAGLKPDELKKIRNREPTGDAKRDALIRFVRTRAQTSGTISDDDFAAIKAAGYSDAELVEISLVFATTVFTNVFNRINDTELGNETDHLDVNHSKILLLRLSQSVAGIRDLNLRRRSI